MAGTMRDVARRANVSLAAVSYVINQGPRPVSRELRERVLAAMRELGYQPGRRGRVKARPLTIGAVVPDAANPFFARALHGLETALRAEGHLLLAASSPEDPDRERGPIAAVPQARGGGPLRSPLGPAPGE